MSEGGERVRKRKNQFYFLYKKKIERKGGEINYHDNLGIRIARVS